MPTILTQFTEAELRAILSDAVSAALQAQSPQQQIVQENAQEPALKLDQVTKLFGVSKTTILAWCKDGKLPHFHIGRRLYFPRAEIIALVNGKKKRSR